MNNKRWDALWINAQIATMENNAPYGLIKNAALAIMDGKIAWLGAMADLQGEHENLAEQILDVEGRCITPGLIDCHTHLVYAGNRANEFEMRLQGMSYSDIAKSGGGIASTVAATRDATEEKLFQESMKRAHAMVAGGVTTIEIKSGYGLDVKNELKMLRVAHRIGVSLPVTIFSTFLGAHALPPEYQNRADEYISYVCTEMIPAVAHAKLARAVDVFCDEIGFNLLQTERVFSAAKQYGLAVKCHAEQLTNMNGAALAARYDALSVDHLEHLSEEGVRELAHAGTVAVLLPGAFYFLREKKMPPVEWLRTHHVPMAIATDCNPGSSPVTSLLLMLNMACTMLGLTPEEALAGVTRNAAKALGMGATHGTLTVGKVADFVIWDVEQVVELVYYVGWNRCAAVVRGGEVVL